jgi:hypothetical protein
MTALPAFIDPEAWQGFTDMRKAIRKPLTARGELLVLKTLYALKQAGHDANAALDQSTLCNWQDIYAPKPKDIPNLVKTYYEPEPERTPEQIAADHEARKRVMDAIRPAIRRVA